MPRSCCWSAASLLALSFAAGASAHAATVLERSIDIGIQPDGSVSERIHLRVRLDEPGDLSRWSPYSVVLDENRELVDLSASAVRPDGKKLNVPRRDLDTMQVTAAGELHSSRQLRTVTFPTVPVGSVLALDYEVRERPYFPAGDLDLGLSDPVQSLRIAVRGGGAGWRWRIDGALPGVDVQETEGGVIVTAANLPRLNPPDRAPGIAYGGAVLRYSWGDAAGWDGVGRWFEGLLGQVSRGAEPVRRKAVELIAGIAERERRIEILADFARRRVRYVAVEVGIGGYRPAAPQQTMERLWGDCKDKALLLIDLLREAGVEAYPALIRLDPEGRVDRELPSPYQFNHMIVAVPAAGLALKEAPIAGGYLFLDATQQTGGLAWLQPAVQDQEALVVRGGRGELVRTPIRSGDEGRRLEGDLELAASGEASGTVRLDLAGEMGAAFIELHAGGTPLEVDRVIREVFAAFLPAGAVLDGIRWQSIEGGVPEVRLEAKVRLPSLGAPAEAGAMPTIPLPSLVDLPAPGLLDGRTVPVVTSPFASRVAWRVTLPRDACKAEGQDVAVQNGLGAFRQTIAVQGKVLVVERGTDLRQRWIDPDAFPALKEIALAESRTNKRRLRLSCG